MVTQAIPRNTSILLFRLKFDAVKGTASSTGHSGDQPSRCLWCQSNIKHAEIKRSAADPAAQLQDDQHETKATTKMYNYVHSLQLAKSFKFCQIQQKLEEDRVGQQLRLSMIDKNTPELPISLFKLIVYDSV